MQAALNNNLTLGSYSSFLNDYCFTQVESKDFCSRYYDPSTGRFLQQDPDPGKLASPNTFLSKYIYGANNPVMFSDPSGRSFWENLGRIGFAIASFYAGALAASAAIGFFALGGWEAALVGVIVGAAAGGIVGSISFPALGLGSSKEGFELGIISGAFGGLAQAIGFVNLKNPIGSKSFFSMWNNDLVTNGVKGINSVKHLPNAFYNSINFGGDLVTSFLSYSQGFFNVAIPFSAGAYLINETNKCVNYIPCTFPSLPINGDF